MGRELTWESSVSPPLPPPPSESKGEERRK